MAATPRIFRVPITLPASLATAAPLNIPHGTAPSSPVNGDIWTTTAAAFVRINSGTKTLDTLEDTQTFTGTKTFATSGIKVGQTTLAQGVNGTVTLPAKAGTIPITTTNHAAYPGTGTEDWNSITTPGLHPVVLIGNSTNGPGDANYYYVEVFRYNDNSTFTQVATPYLPENGGGWMRAAYSGNDWHPWVRVPILTSSDPNPAMDGTAAPGTSARGSRADHVHPTDTSRATDSLVVHLAGTETITGAKTFTTKPVMSVSSGGSAQFQSSIVGYNWIELRSSATGAFNGANAILFTNYGDTGRQFQMTSLVGGGLIFETGDGSSTTTTERMRIDSAGSVLADDIRSLALVMGAF